MSECILWNIKRSCIPVFLSTCTQNFGENPLALNSAQFTTVLKHDSWEASTEDNAQRL